MFYHLKKKDFVMTEENIKFHIDFIKSMSIYDIKSFLKCAHKNHIYYTIDILNDIFQKQRKKLKQSF
jgi:hypothetical protein